MPVSAVDKATNPIMLDGYSLTLEQLEVIARNNVHVDLSSQAKQQLTASRAIIDRLVEGREIVYGITTGFGKFKDVHIAPEDSIQLQRNLLLSHAVGVGELLDRPAVRATVLLRANALAKGFSGIRTDVVELLVALLNNDIYPCIPEQGSCGASGDLAPLAHLGLVLIGEGEAEVDGKIIAGSEALLARNLAPVSLHAKEGLALINGTQVMAAIGSLVVLEAERLAKMADIIGAMSLEAQLGSAKAFSELIHKTRPHPGQLDSAANLRKMLENSKLMVSHADCPMVQDAYSLRCMPQVHGASRQAFKHAREVLEIEINSATDNPLVFEECILSGGNFHGQPLALVMDYVAIALAELANISERRTERLVNPALSNGLPAFLTRRGGLNSGFMVAQYTAASLVSENKSLAHPASVDSIPTSANQEDHVSMGTISARKARQIMKNVRNVFAIELMCACQGLDLRTSAYLGEADDDLPTFCHDTSGIAPSTGVEAAYAYVRKHISHLGQDRNISKDIKIAERIIASGELIEVVEKAIGKLN